MRKEAIFLNGVFESVIKRIMDIQEYLPEQILYLQPHKSERMVNLAENPPSVDDPVRLLMSVTDDLPNVKYICEIVGWDDKRTLSGRKLDILNRIVYALQWPEPGIYKTADDDGPVCVNLLYVRRMQELGRPFSVRELTNTNNGEQLSPYRSTAGGWVYVFKPTEDWISSYL